MLEPRRLRGHRAATTCCVASSDRPGVIATAGEDGCVCWFDMRCKDVQLIMEVGEQPISSLCFKSGNEDIIYVASERELKCFDVHMAASCKQLKNYIYNKDEINQIACNSKGTFLASADDGGDVKICSSVQFIPWRPWEVVTGGLDSKLILWDFSKGRPVKIVDFALPYVENGSNAAQCFNPAFVHAIAVPDANMLDKSNNVCVVARGDGSVDVINIESELAAIRSKPSRRARKGTQSTSKDSISTVSNEIHGQNERTRLHLDYTLGGHNAAVSCVAFSLFGERGKYIISGGNDKSVKVWDCSQHLDAGQTGCHMDVLRLNVNLSKKVNWLCTCPTESENLVVCDTTKVVKVYSVS